MIYFPNNRNSSTSLLARPTVAFSVGIKRSRDHNPHFQAEKSSERVISFTPINANSRLMCPYPDCHRNICSPKRTFARADNLGSHLRNVHGLALPARARVRKWIGQTKLPSTGLNNIDTDKTGKFNIRCLADPPFGNLEV